MKETYEYLIKKHILSFELNKNQTYVERLMKEGELIAYNKIVKFLENSINDNDIKELHNTLTLARNSKNIIVEELNVLKAKELIFNEMNKDIEGHIYSLDKIKEIEQNKKDKKYSKDVQGRINKGLCALKRPGKGGFICDNEVIEGTKYCKEHLKLYDKITYIEYFGK